jgi:hypothetical protein
MLIPLMNIAIDILAEEGLRKLVNCLTVKG